MCAQRDASGTSMRLMRTDRKTPLAVPQGFAPSPSCSGSSAPTTDGSRRAQPGYSVGGGGGGRLRLDTSSTALSSPGETTLVPPSSAAPGSGELATLLGAGAGAGCCCATC